jgi:hypothetical protein
MELGKTYQVENRGLRDMEKKIQMRVETSETWKILDLMTHDLRDSEKIRICGTFPKRLPKIVNP